MGATSRRAFVAGSTALILTPLGAGAEQPGRVFRIGIPGNVPRTSPEGAHL